MLRWSILVGSLILAQPASAGGLDKASDGYVYFHRLGADLATHDEAVDDCALAAASLDQPYLQKIVAVGEPVAGVAAGNVIAEMIHNAQQTHLNRRQFAANLENCMVVRGWDVVRLDDSEGKRVSALGQSDQATALAPWVGAAGVHGEVVRTFAPVYAQRRLVLGVYDNLAPPALSLTAAAHKLSRIVTPSDPANWRALKAADATAIQPPNASVIVVRMWTSAPRHQLGLNLARLDGESGKDAVAAGMDLIQAASPVRFLWGPGPLLQTTFVIPVKPGRWRLLGPQSISLCLGGPAFDVHPGEAVFAGSFDAAAQDYLAPDLSLDAVRPTLQDTALAARLRPARWMNGQMSPCGLAWATVIYSYDMPGVTRFNDAAVSPAP